MSRNRCFWIFLLITLFYSGTQAEMLLDTDYEYISTKASDPGYRIPTDFMPEAYNIQLSEINLEAQTFSGSTTITFWCLTTTNNLTLHSSSLNIMQIAVTIMNLNDTTITITHMRQTNALYETLIISADPAFVANNFYRITFAAYTGVMTHGMFGFYTSRYNNGEQPQIMGVTQLFPGNARKVFPCFDEPAFKARFTLAIQRPLEYEPSFSNMKIDPDAPTANNWDRFLETPKMSTYLLAFMVSQFTIIKQWSDLGGNTFRIIGRPGSDGQGQYTFDEGLKIVNAMSSYMNLNYFALGNNKLDHAALTDFAYGAMENWGLITYNEAYLLSSEESSIRNKQKVSTILAHETAHMWFGDFVTYHWFSDAWLNEGFARLYEYKITDMIETTQYNMMTQFPVIEVQAAFLADTSVRSAPMTNNEVNSQDEIMAHFSIISYGKAASVIRMVENWVGEENFRSAMNQYMQANMYGSVTPEDMYRALQIYALAGQNIANMMSSWVTASGYPLITVSVNYNTNTITLSQRRFKKPWEADVTHLFQVPITVATRTNPSFENKTTDYLLTTQGAVLTIPFHAQNWVVLNKQQIGYYRVNYDAATWYRLRDVLVGWDRRIIHQVNRAQIVDDVFNLAREDVLSYTTTFDILDFLANENDYAPWQAAFPGFNFIRQQLGKNSRILTKLDSHIRILLKYLIDTLGFSDTGDNLTKLFRLNTMNFACALEYTECVDFANATFNDFHINSIPVNPNFREFVYCTGLRYGNDDAFDHLWRKYVFENMADEKLLILEALGCSTSATMITRFLNETMQTDSLIRRHNTMTAINAILNGNLDNAEHVLKYVEDNFLSVRNKLGSYTTLFPRLGSRLTGHQISRFHQLITDNAESLTKEEIVAGMTAYSELALQGSYMIHAGQVIETWLDDKYNVPTTTLTPAPTTTDGSGGSTTDDPGAGMIVQSSIILLCTAILIVIINISSL